jgi:DNA-binding transcriptional regulator YiaG
MEYKHYMTGLEFTRFRLSKDLTQEEISILLGVSVVTVKSWEHERRNIPKTVNNFIRLSISQVPSETLKMIIAKIKQYDRSSDF